MVAKFQDTEAISLLIRQKTLEIKSISQRLVRDRHRGPRPVGVDYQGNIAKLATKGEEYRRRLLGFESQEPPNTDLINAEFEMLKSLVATKREMQETIGLYKSILPADLGLAQLRVDCLYDQLEQVNYEKSLLLP